MVASPVWLERGAKSNFLAGRRGTGVDLDLVGLGKASPKLGPNRLQHLVAFPGLDRVRHYASMARVAGSNAIPKKSVRVVRVRPFGIGGTAVSRMRA